MTDVHLTYNIDGGDFTSAGEASGDMKRALRSMGVSSEIIRRCAICMYEGEINMVIHADGGDAEVLFDGQKIRIILSDSGPGIPDIDTAMLEGYSTATDQVRDLGFGAGMGLPNIKKHSDVLKLESTVGVGTTLTIIINL